MSLIHEALRKARRESEDGESRGVVYSRGLTGHRGRRGVGLGILFGVLLSAVTAVMVGGALWLRLAGRAEQRSASSVIEAPAEDRTAAPAPPEPTAPDPTGDAIPLAIASAPGDQAEIPAPTPQATEPVTIPVAVAPHDQSERPSASPTAGPAPRPTAAPSQPGERVYDVEADLGYATLTLDYIVFRSTDPFAQINGLDIRVGSTIEGFTVEEIGRSSVRLRDDRGPLILRVP